MTTELTLTFPFAYKRPMSNWTADNIPDQFGRTAIVTGANAGLGYETALALAQKGAHVILACRSENRGQAALDKIKSANPSGSVELMLLDLADLESVRSFSASFLENHRRLDLLINNAGVMVPPDGKTKLGFETQFGINVIGHFALTGRLLDRLNETDGARIVTLSSIAHRQGKIDFGNLRGEKPYRAMREYCQSKLANLILAIEMHHRLQKAGQSTVSVAAHPGVTHTELQRHSGLWDRFAGFWSNTPPIGALPTLFAATSPDAEPGGYYGSKGFLEMRGYPGPADVKSKARDRDVASSLWTLCEDATDVRYLSE